MPPPLLNFGHNVRATPHHYYAPRSEREVVEILDRHRGATIRAVGTRHAWSPGIAGSEVLLSLRYLQGVEVRGEVARVGGGTTIRRLVEELRKEGLTLPAMGLINRQTIAGATATGTHGSGRKAIGGYLQSVRVVHYGPDGRARVTTIEGGDALRVARCSLGSLGIVVEAAIEVRKMYRIEEHLAQYDTLEEVLQLEAEYLLQQFYLLPWSWKYLAQHRRETQGPRSRLAMLYRWYWWLMIDIGLHLVIIFLARWLRWSRVTRGLYRHLLPKLVVKGWRVVDHAPDQLVMEHQLFRHIEIEMFVTTDRLAEALEFTRGLLQILGGEGNQTSDGVWQQLKSIGLADRVGKLAGSYCHHYVICVRKVLPDDGVLSMASGGDEGEPHYALSFISYQRPNDRAGFDSFAKLLSDALGQLFDARPHWGKVCPLDAESATRLYPQLATWREVASEFDPQGAFLNDWLRGLFRPTATAGRQVPPV